MPIRIATIVAIAIGTFVAASTLDAQTCNQCDEAWSSDTQSWWHSLGGACFAAAPTCALCGGESECHVEWQEGPCQIGCEPLQAAAVEAIEELMRLMSRTNTPPLAVTTKLREYVQLHALVSFELEPVSLRFKTARGNRSGSGRCLGT